jgi:NADPH:quinone reductase-like Zn-dependent oxidoreductase
LKAAVYRAYGPPEVVRIEDVDRPIPKDNEVLIRVRFTTICAADVRFRKADPFLIRFMNGLSRPKKATILGLEFAGTVEAAGKDVTNLAAGDEVFGATEFKFGCHAEYICVGGDSRYVAKRPPGVTPEDAAAIPFGGVSSLHFLRKASIQPGQKVLVYGASGSLGTFGVQLAKHYGAHVTGVCSTANVDLVRSLGADDVIDYTKEDFSRRGKIYDVVYETVGKASSRQVLGALKPGGLILQAALMPGLMFRGMAASMTGRARYIAGVAMGQAGDLDFLAGLVGEGKLRTVIDRRYRLHEIVEAHRHADTGHKKGTVIVAVA